jgi:hypothetical protein
VGTEGVIGKTKIDPLAGKVNEAQADAPGLNDETVDTARIMPLGEVREEYT